MIEKVNETYEDGIDVVVVNYRTTSLLNNFIESYNNSSLEHKSLYVVDNDPLPEDVETNRIISKNAFYVFVKTNIGYAKACNLAASLNFSNRKYIAFINSDCVLFEHTLKQMYEGMESLSLPIAGPLQYDRERRVTHAGIFGSTETPVHRGWRSANIEMFRDIKECVTISGSAYFIRRDVWDELTSCPLYRDVAPDAKGAFLPTQHFYEETFCSYHAAAHGYPVTYYGAAEMIHEWHKSSKVGNSQTSQWMNESQAYFRSACDHHNIVHD
jgi:GT2 family glycosyltransferase